MKKKSFVALGGIIMAMSLISSFNVAKQKHSELYAGVSYLIYSNVENPVGRGISYGSTMGFSSAAGACCLAGGPVGWTLGAVCLM